MNKQIKETAAAGSVSALAIAVTPGRMGVTKKRNLKGFMVNYYKNIRNKLQMIPVNLYKIDSNKKVKVVSSIKEGFNLDSVLAQLSSYENKTNNKTDDVVTYGVEDDKGNLMKVTILNTQAEDFESYISAYLSQLKDFESSGVELEDISLAELLYKLKDLFDIRDVQFPNIPEDTVYNADEASESVEDNPKVNSNMGDEEGFDDFDDTEDMGDEEGFDDEGLNDLDNTEDMNNEVGLSDDESVENFEDIGDNDSSTRSILNSVMDMLKAQAEEQKARYEAEAEKARAQQAEYSARAAEATISNKEELIAMQAEKNSQKEEEKRAKQEADLATYRYKKSRGMLDDKDAAFEGFSNDSLLMQAILNEEDVLMDPALIKRQEMIERKALMDQKMAAKTDAERKEISQLISLLPRKFMMKRQEAKARLALKAGEQEEENNQNQNNQNQNNQNQNNQNQNNQNRNQQGQLEESFITETISPTEYRALDEAVKRQFKRYGNKYVRKFRCYGGPKDGAMVTSAADCGLIKDPDKVRQGKISARLKRGQRIRKTNLTKRKAPSERLSQMNVNLRKGT